MIPKALTSRPELEVWEATYIQDFYRLSSSRQQGMNVGAIPVSEILAYCEFFDIPEAEDFLYIIQSMDNAYMEKVAEKQAQEQAASKNSKGKKTVRGVK